LLKKISDCKIFTVIKKTSKFEIFCNKTISRIEKTEVDFYENINIIDMPSILIMTI
jgi:hypothetical protein